MESSLSRDQQGVHFVVRQKREPDLQSLLPRVLDETEEMVGDVAAAAAYGPEAGSARAAICFADGTCPANPTSRHSAEVMRAEEEATERRHSALLSLRTCPSLCLGTQMRAAA